MATRTRSFKRITSLVKLRGRHETPYESWADTDSASEVEAATPTPQESAVVVEFPEMTAAASPEPLPLDQQDRIPRASCGLETGESLVECFYIGSMDMVGLTIKGRGCIDMPAAKIWEHTQQQDRRLKRKNSWPMKQQHDSTPRPTHPVLASPTFKPRYVKLVTGSDTLRVHDQATNQLLTEFNYRKISFVGTHPKYSRLFAFIAGSGSTAFCHAFKCEDKDCAKQAACNLSDVFAKKIQQLLRSNMIQVSAEATVLNPRTS